jgi:hypothetical protein
MAAAGSILRAALKPTSQNGSLAKLPAVGFSAPQGHRAEFL